MLSITKFLNKQNISGKSSTLWKVSSSAWRMSSVLSAVMVASICPQKAKCSWVCFSLISVVLVVYQPGKWLWWCQLTPHCHSRFVSQPHRLGHPSSHLSPSLTPTSHPHHPPLVVFLSVNLRCNCFQLIFTVIIFSSKYRSMMMINDLFRSVSS